MEKYLGVKLLGAKPMTRGEFAKYKYHKEVNEGLPEDEGYLVEYEGGYQSWSPKDVFEKAYNKVIHVNEPILDLGYGIPEYQQRVFGEAVELRSNCIALYKFIYNSELFDNVKSEEKSRLMQQLRAMEYYLNILRDRITAFKSE